MTGLARADASSRSISSSLARAVVSFAALLAAGDLGLRLLRTAETAAAPLWPASGVAVAVVLLGGIELLPVVALASIITSWSPGQAPQALIYAIGDGLAAGLSWYLLTRRTAFDPTFRRRADVVQFVVFGAVIGTLPSATLSVSARSLLGDSTWSDVPAWLTWWLGNVAAVLVIAPPFLTFRRDWFTEIRKAGRRAEAAAVVALLVIVAACGAWAGLSRTVILLQSMLTLPLVLWASLRLGPFGAATAALLASIGGMATLLATPSLGVARDAVSGWWLWATNIEFAATALLITAVDAERSNAERDVRVREARYRAIVERGVDMICRYRPDGTLTFVNQAYCRYFGRTCDEMIGRSFVDQVPPDERPALVRMLQALRPDMVPVVHEHRVRLADGTVRWNRWTNSAIRGDDGACHEYQAVGRDVTAEHIAAEERDALMRRNRALVQALAEIVYDHDLEHDRIEWDGGVERVLGYTLAQLGRDTASWTARVHPDDLPRALRQLSMAAERDRVLDLEYRFLRRDGSWAWMHDRGVIFASDDGQPIRVIGVLRDITARKESEAKLRDSEQRFRLAAAFGSDLIYEWNLQNDTILRFGRVTEMLGDVVPEVIEHRATWEQMIQVDDRPRVLAAVQRHLETGAPYREQYRVSTRDGQVRIWTDRGAALRDADGRPVKWIGVTTDVTDQVHLEEQLRQSQKMESVGQLAGGVAHDFNNLLQVIQGYALLAQDDAAPELERHANLAQVIDAADRAAQLTRQLLAFGRRQPMQFVSIDLADLVGQLLKLLRRLIGEHIVVDFTATGDTGPVRCDRTQIEQVLVNLCVNARDAMPNGGRLTIRVDELAVSDDEARRKPGLRAGRFVRLRVADTGVGMDDATRRRVFEPFFTTKPEGRGTGLGLAVVYGIVKQHDGYIDVSSIPGRGTTFMILLPFQPAARTDVREPQREPARGRAHEVILLAEDELSVRHLGESVLKSAGYRVISAEDGQQALEIFRARGAELTLVILDVVMPRLGGRDVAQTISSVRPDLPVLLCSGYPGTNPDGTPLSPRWSFLQKPWRPRELLERVRALIENRGVPTPEPPYVGDGRHPGGSSGISIN